MLRIRAERTRHQLRDRDRVRKLDHRSHQEESIMIVRALQNSRFDYPWSRRFSVSHTTPFDLLRNEFERLLSSQDRVWGNACYSAPTGSPEVDIIDEGSQLKLSASLPGLSEKDLELQLTAEGVVLRGERKVSVPDGYTARRRERRTYAFERTIRLPMQIDPDKAEASLTNGVLTVTLPKAEAAKPRNIAVRTA